jgi:hypothetical protein
MEELFHEALNQNEREREAWLREQCDEDHSLLQSTSALLLAYRQEQDATQKLSQSSVEPAMANTKSRWR